METVQANKKLFDILLSANEQDKADQKESAFGTLDSQQEFLRFKNKLFGKVKEPQSADQIKTEEQKKISETETETDNSNQVSINEKPAAENDEMPVVINKEMPVADN